jgi:hypothetical protein
MAVPSIERLQKIPFAANGEIRLQRAGAIQGEPLTGKSEQDVETADRRTRSRGLRRRGAFEESRIALGPGRLHGQ